MSKSYRHDNYDRFERKRRAESRNARRSGSWFNQSNRKDRSQTRDRGDFGFLNDSAA